MCGKVKIQNSTGDWKCPKCGCLNTELKENIKKIDRVLCRSCFSELDIDKDESQKNKVEIKMQSYNNMIIVNVNGEKTNILLDDECSGVTDGIYSILEDLGIESEIVDD